MMTEEKTLTVERSRMLEGARSRRPAALFGWRATDPRRLRSCGRNGITPIAVGLFLTEATELCLLLSLKS